MHKDRTFFQYIRKPLYLLVTLFFALNIDAGFYGYGPSKVIAASPSYRDMQNHWANQQVVLLSLVGVIQGYEDGTFRPDRTITRAEAARIITSAFHGPSQPLTGAAKPFFDVPAEHWAFSDIVLSREKGYFQGDEKGLFYPDRPMTRSEFFAVCLRVLGWQNIPLQTQMDLPSDWEEVPDWAAPILQRALQTGLADGYKDDTIRAGQPVKRSEAIAVIYRMFENQGRLFAFHGEVLSKTEKSIAIGTETGQTRNQQIIPMLPSVTVFRDGRIVQFLDVLVGDRAFVLVSQLGEVKAVVIQRSSP